MKRLAHDTLPLATTSPFTKGGAGRADTQGWRRALTVARGAMRCDTDVRSPAPLLEAGPVPDRRPGESMTAVPPTHERHTIPAADLHGKRLGTPDPDAPARREDRPLSVHAARAAALRVQDLDGGEDSAIAAVRPRQAVPVDTAPPIRVHVERQEDGIAIWLGVRGHVPAKCLDAVLADLASPARPGERVVAVTCNGTPVYTRSTNRKESP